MSESSETRPETMPEARAQLAPKLITELVADPDFPKSAVGQQVDIKGFTGVVTEIVKNSIKVRSAAGNTVSYNFNALRRLYGPRAEAEPVAPEETPPIITVSPPQPKREIIEEPNFDAPLLPIEGLVHRPDFPKCALGLHVDLHGFSGVAVDLVGRSLKVRSRQGSTRSYNADVLRKQWATAPRR